MTTTTNNDLAARALADFAATLEKASGLLNEADRELSGRVFNGDLSDDHSAILLGLSAGVTCLRDELRCLAKLATVDRDAYRTKYGWGGGLSTVGRLRFARQLAGIVEADCPDTMDQVRTLLAVANGQLNAASVMADSPF